MSDESQNDKFAGDLISDMVNTVRRAEATNGGVRNSQTANAGDVTYETVTKAYAETCRIASERTNGAYRCTRAPHTDGPCAAVPVPGFLYFSKDGERFECLGRTTGISTTPANVKKSNLYWFDLEQPTRWERIKDWLLSFRYDKDDIARFREPKWNKKKGELTTDSMGNSWLNCGKESIQFTGKVTAGAEKLFGYPVILDDSVPFDKITFGPAPEIQPRQPISTLTFCHRITIMFGAFKMLRMNKQPFNWRSIPELVRYLRNGKLPGMDKPFKAETLKAFGVPAEKFAQGGFVAPSKTPYIVGENSLGQEYKLGQDCRSSEYRTMMADAVGSHRDSLESAIASFENFGKTVERTGASLSDFHKAANLIKHASECEFQPKSAEHDQIDCTCQPRRARAELWTRILTAYWGFPILWNAGLWNVERRTWAALFNYVFRRIIPAPNPQSEHTIENSNPTQNARNKQHHQPRPQSERYAIIYLCIIAALWLLSLIVGIVFNWPAYR